MTCALLAAPSKYQAERIEYTGPGGERGCIQAAEGSIETRYVCEAGGHIFIQSFWIEIIRDLWPKHKDTSGRDAAGGITKPKCGIRWNRPRRETGGLRGFIEATFSDVQLGPLTMENVQVPEIPSLSKIFVDCLLPLVRSRENAAVLDCGRPSDVLVTHLKRI